MFGIDGKFYEIVSAIADLVILNLLFVLCSLPIFTIGASTTALFGVTKKMADNREGYIVRTYFKLFKENFKQATEIWLIYLVIGILLGFDFMMGNQAKDTLGVCMQGAAMILAIPYFLSLLYVFGVQSRFVNPVKDTIRYSFFMALRNMKCTIQMAILMILLVWANTTVLLVNFLTLVYGFGLMGYFFAAYYKKAFGKYLNPEENS